MDVLNNPGAELFIPDGSSLTEAFHRTTHMAIAAHADDLEIMAYHGISQCFGQEEHWFFGVVMTDGTGSPRSGEHHALTNAAMRQLRQAEQKKAACIGGYSGIAFLDYSSADLKKPGDPGLMSDLQALFTAARPDLLYLHNPVDSHDTHVAAMLQCITALRKVPEELRPQRVLGCEVWCGLEWLSETDKVRLDVSGLPNIAQALLGVFDSQISGGKRYDHATLGRRLANATFDQAHTVDHADGLTLAMDLTPLIRPPYPTPDVWVAEAIDRFKVDTLHRIELFQTNQD